ncbi:hypothetical protein ACIPJK_35500 [Streptomyces roseus]|uniref:hypothetical protein n=1 Tax=Streptomyces roseus TaxID=66430 RepID=UPI0037F74570
MAALFYPVPQPDNTYPNDVLIYIHQDMDRRREDYAADLEAKSLSMEADPLILALQEAKHAREAADRRTRLLLAYAREFHPPRRYSLSELGNASGYTFSGVRTAYGDREIAQVQGQIGRAPRRATSAEEIT